MNTAQHAATCNCGYNPKMFPHHAKVGHNILCPVREAQHAATPTFSLGGRTFVNINNAVLIETDIKRYSIEVTDGMIVVLGAKHADFIVRACNSHDALVAALNECKRKLGYCRTALASGSGSFAVTTTDTIDKARAALAAASDEAWDEDEWYAAGNAALDFIAAAGAQ